MRNGRGIIIFGVFLNMSLLIIGASITGMFSTGIDFASIHPILEDGISGAVLMITGAIGLGLSVWLN